MLRGRGRGRPLAVATRVSFRQRLPPPTGDAGAESSAQSGAAGCGRARRGARGRGGRAGALVAPPPVAMAPMEGHAGDQPLEFIVKLRGPPHSRLRLPTPFARVMEVEHPPGLRLHMRGCCNGSMWADVEFLAPHVMLLRRG
jgi:hypothetical protein